MIENWADNRVLTILWRRLGVGRGEQVRPLERFGVRLWVTRGDDVAVRHRHQADRLEEQQADQADDGAGTDRRHRRLHAGGGRTGRMSAQAGGGRERDDPRG